MGSQQRRRGGDSGRDARWIGRRASALLAGVLVLAAAGVLGGAGTAGGAERSGDAAREGGNGQAAAIPIASSRAQPVAHLGGTMRDELMLAPGPARSSARWDGARAVFTAYLLPEVGEPKYGPHWTALRGGSRAGQPGEVLTWGAEELAAMTPDERCMAQPVYASDEIELSGLESTPSPAVRVGSPGTIHWVEEIDVSERIVHRGICGAPSATTLIPRARLETKAPPTIRMGQIATDTAFLTGPVPPEARYSVRFEAFVVADQVPEGTAPTRPPQCAARDRVFLSAEIPVLAPGALESPGFVVEAEHAPGLRWVATLSFIGPSGRIALQRGTCGDPAETTTVEFPSVSTLADAEVAVGEAMRDRALVEGLPPAREGVDWEIGFQVFGGPPLKGPAAPGEPVAEASCEPENLLAETATVAVRGPGEVSSPSVIAAAGWEGRVHWVATLWVLADGQRFEVHRGRCGDEAETTLVAARAPDDEQPASEPARAAPRPPRAAGEQQRTAPDPALARTGMAVTAPGLSGFALASTFAGLTLLLGRGLHVEAVRVARAGRRRP